MEPLSLAISVLFAGTAALGATAAVAERVRRAALRRRVEPRLRSLLKTAAERLEITQLEERRPAGRRLALEGRLGSLRVELVVEWRGKRPAVWVRVSELGHTLEQLTVRVDLGDAEGARRYLVRDQVIGAPDFDDRFFVIGSLELALTLLDWQTRSLLKDRLLVPHPLPNPLAPEPSATLSDNQLTAHLAAPIELPDDVLLDDLTTDLAAVLCLAQRLAKPRDPASRLSVNLGEEPMPGVRLNTLRQLVREYPEHPDTAAAVRTCLGDQAPEVRLEAALASGRDGHEVLKALVETTETPEVVAARAVAALGHAFTVEAAAKTLRQALKRGKNELTRACLDTVARHGRMGRRGDSELETLLLRALGRHDEGVVLAAVQALGQVGSVAAVPRLRELEAEATKDLARATRQSIAEIQMRLKGAEQGQLSLAGAEAGALSFGSAEAGELALVEAQEPGRLSLAGGKLSRPRGE